MNRQVQRKVMATEKRVALFVTVVALALMLAGGVLAATVRGDGGAGPAPGWAQVNDDGFGEGANNVVSVLEPAGASLYAATWNQNGAQVWRSDDGTSWTADTPPWAAANNTANDIAVLGGEPYVATSNFTNGAEVWRRGSGGWEQVVSGGFGDTDNGGVAALGIFDGAIYGATSNSDTGLEVWRSASGDSGSWQNVYNAGADVPAGGVDVTMDLFSGHLYLGTSRSGVAELTRTDDGVTWTSVFSDGLGTADNTNVTAMAEFQGNFYIALRNVTTGAQLWRSADGLSWDPVFTGGLGDADNGRPYGLVAYNNELFLIIGNLDTGSQVWRSSDGTTWVQEISDGWGDAGNVFADYFDHANTIFDGFLYVGTQNAAGGEVWKRLETALFLPSVLNGASAGPTPTVPGPTPPARTGR